MSGKVVINLTTGHEDAEKVTLAFLVATAALEHRRPVMMFTTKEAVRLGLPGYADAIVIPEAPPVSRLFGQFRDWGGELVLCPICVRARRLDESALIAPARIGGATALWDWIGDEPATVFSY